MGELGRDWACFLFFFLLFLLVFCFSSSSILLRHKLYITILGGFCPCCRASPRTKGTRVPEEARRVSHSTAGEEGLSPSSRGCKESMPTASASESRKGLSSQLGTLQGPPLPSPAPSTSPVQTAQQPGCGGSPEELPGSKCSVSITRPAPHARVRSGPEKPQHPVRLYCRPLPW